MGTMVFQDSFFGGGRGTCGVCGRTLTNPISIARGIGPVCSGKGYGQEGQDMARTEDHCDRYINEPIEDGIILKRDENGVATNVRHVVTHHSPTGFEWGYGGSGPADLALNIVEIMLHRLGYEGERTECFQGTCFRQAFKLHQDFKWTFISGVPREGAVLSYEEVWTWVQERAFVVEDQIPF